MLQLNSVMHSNNLFKKTALLSEVEAPPHFYKVLVLPHPSDWRQDVPWLSRLCLGLANLPFCFFEMANSIMQNVPNFIALIRSTSALIQSKSFITFFTLLIKKTKSATISNK